MIYVYGSDEFVTKVWRACGKVKILKDVADIYEIPCGAVLYTDLPLHATTNIKLKMPCITVRTPVTEIEDVWTLQLNVYELLTDIENWGTCHVYVRDDGLRKALSQLAGGTPIRFVDNCPPTYPCALRTRPADLLTSLIFESLYHSYHRPRLPPVDASRPLRSYTIPTSITTVMLPKMSKAKDIRCTAIGTPLFDADWDYYVEYPPDMAPEELAAALKEGRLKFLKVIPVLKPLESLCPKRH